MRLLLLSLVFLLTACANPTRQDFKTWQVAGEDPQQFLSLPLVSGQVVVIGSGGIMDMGITLIPESYPPYLHAGILVIDDGSPYVYDITGAAGFNLTGLPPTDVIKGKVQRIPFGRFVRRYHHVAIYEPTGLDKERIADYARTQLREEAPFDPYFNYAEHKKLYCTEFIALALEAGGAEHFELPPNRPNRSVSVVLDWLKIPDQGLLMPSDLVVASKRVALLSTRHTLSEIYLLNALKEELHRRFTCDQRLGNLFYWNGFKVRLRKPVDRFMDAGLLLFPLDSEVDEREARLAVRELADEMYGELPETAALSRCDNIKQENVLAGQ